MLSILSKFKRTIIQSLSAFILLLPFVDGKIRWFCTPVMNCHACALSHFVCPIGVIAKYPSSYFTFPFVAMGIVFILGALFGRALCGWVCPIGLLQDLLYKIPTPKFKVPHWFGFGKYLSLIFLVIVLPIFSEYFFCNLFCFTAGVQVTIPNLIMGTQSVTMTTLPGTSIPFPAIVNSSAPDIILWTTTIRLSITILLLILVIFTSRLFCKILCPIGALLAIFNYFSFFKIKQPSRCISCKKCDKSCPMDCEPMSRISQGIPANQKGECIVCNQCSSDCPMVAKDKRDAQAQQKEEKNAI